MALRIFDRPAVTVVIPTYNEHDNIEAIVDAVLAVDSLRIIVVDDASPDGTGAVADRLVQQHPLRVSVLHRERIRGLGSALLEGFRAAISVDADVICQMDADGSHDANDLPSLIAALADADLVIGSRYIPGAHVFDDWPLSRRILSASANAYLRLVLGLSIHDVTSGFRVWRRSAIERLTLDCIRSRGHNFQAEITYAAASTRLRIREWPIRFRDRSRGQSKVSSRTIAESIITPWRLRRTTYETSPTRAPVTR